MANVNKCILFKTIEEINYFFPYQIIARAMCYVWGVIVYKIHWLMVHGEDHDQCSKRLGSHINWN